MSNKVEHTTIRNGKLFCLNCGGKFDLPLPIPIDEMSKKIDAFNVLHEDCPKTWTEPIANPQKSLEKRAIWWVEHGEKGLSSETMWHCLFGSLHYQINHPYDPDDFSRCYKLLQTVPEWKTELHKLKPLSKRWSNLVDNWDKLTELFEDMDKNKKDNGMYEFMKTLIK